MTSVAFDATFMITQLSIVMFVPFTKALGSLVPHQLLLTTAIPWPYTASYPVEVTVSRLCSFTIEEYEISTVDLST